MIIYLQTILHKLCLKILFFPIINRPNRTTDTSVTVLDHIGTNILDRAVKSEIIAIPVSDHLPVLACISIKSKHKQSCENLINTRQFTLQIMLDSR